MSPIAAKVTSIEKRGDQYQVIVQISSKYRGSTPALAWETRFRFGLFIDRGEEEEGMGPNSCATMNRFWRGDL